MQNISKNKIRPTLYAFHGISTLVLNPYFSQSLSLYSHVSLAQANLPEMCHFIVLAATGGITLVSAAD